MDIIKKYEIGYTQVSNKVLCDPKLSERAKGIYAYLFSKPEGWQFHESVVQKEIQCSHNVFKSIVNELVERGYITKRQFNENGRFGGMIYEFINPEKNDEIPSADFDCDGQNLLTNNTYKRESNTERVDDIRDESLATPSVSPTSDTFHRFVEWWNNVLVKRPENENNNIGRIMVESAERRRAFSARWKETMKFMGGKPSVEQVFEFMTGNVIGENYINSAFLQGRVRNDRYSEPYRFEFDKVFSPKIWTGLLEKKYYDRDLTMA